MWNYVFYLAYILKQEENDDNGVESYIRKKIKSGDLSWFPFGRFSERKFYEVTFILIFRALEIQDEQKDEENEKQIIESIQKNVQEIIGNVRGINNKNCEK